MELMDEWQEILDAKKVVSKSLEGLRQSKVIGSSLEGEADLYVRSAHERTKKALSKHKNDLRYYFLVSKVELKDGAAPEGAFIGKELGSAIDVVPRKSEGLKCARCWNYYAKEEMDKDHPDICRRCGPVVKAHPAFAGTGTAS
jgi:isoleucyl-tRNA synthetase